MNPDGPRTRIATTRTCLLPRGAARAARAASSTVCVALLRSPARLLRFLGLALLFEGLCGGLLSDLASALVLGGHFAPTLQPASRLITDSGLTHYLWQEVSTPPSASDAARGVRLITASKHPPLRRTRFGIGDLVFLYTTGCIADLNEFHGVHVPSSERHLWARVRRAAVRRPGPEREAASCALVLGATVVTCPRSPAHATALCAAWNGRTGGGVLPYCRERLAPACGGWASR